MNSQCPLCRSTNFSNSPNCPRCAAVSEKTWRAPKKEDLNQSAENNLGKRLDAGAIWFFKRFLGALLISLALLLVAYSSMLYSAAALDKEQNQAVERAVRILEKHDFKSEAWLLRAASFRQNDNWFNVLTGHKDAYAATNFPFQIITLYPEFFTLTVDDTERAAVLLHEASHLQGSGEPKAYEVVWRARRELGWTRQNYLYSQVFQNVKQSTKQFAPNLFVCQGNYENDCTD